MAIEPISSGFENELAHILCSELSSNERRAERLSHVFDALQEQVVILDMHGVIRYANRATEQLTGFSVEEMLGNTPALWRSRECARHTADVVNALERHVAPEREILRNVHKGGMMYETDVRVVLLADEDGSTNHAVLIEHDVRDAAALERVQRRVVALTSHNLKTPLASMRWQVEMMRNGDMGHVSKAQQECLDEIHEGITRTVGMVEQWLVVTNLDVGLYTPHAEQFALDAVVKEVLDELRLRIEQEGVSVRFDAGASPSMLEADRDSVRTIVHTLLFNAVKYNREGGEVHVEITTLPKNTEYHGRTFAEDRLVLSVQDTGNGIPEDEQVRVFQERFHASNLDDLHAAGAGLGLYITRALVQAMSGDIWFSSSSEGSHFVVAVPSVCATGANSPM